MAACITFLASLRSPSLQKEDLFLGLHLPLFSSHQEAVIFDSQMPLMLPMLSAEGDSRLHAQTVRALYLLSPLRHDAALSRVFFFFLERKCKKRHREAADGECRQRGREEE